MIDCPFQLDKKTNLWTCPVCGWEYPKESECPPRRNCSESARVEECDIELDKYKQSPCYKKRIAKSGNKPESNEFV